MKFRKKVRRLKRAHSRQYIKERKDEAYMLMDFRNEARENDYIITAYKLSIRN